MGMMRSSLPIPPATLLAEAGRGAEAAQAQLVDLWLHEVYGWCARLGGPRTDPEDAAHDVFLIVFDRLPTLRSPGAFPSWLFGITRRVLSNHRQRAWLRRWVPGPPVERPDPGADPSQRAELSELARHVRALLERLPAEDREILVLCDAEERTVAEAAALLGIGPEAAKSRLRRARSRFERLARSRGLGQLSLVEGERV